MWGMVIGWVCIVLVSATVGVALVSRDAAGLSRCADNCCIYARWRRDSRPGMRMHCTFTNSFSDGSFARSGGAEAGIAGA